MLRQKTQSRDDGVRFFFFVLFDGWQNCERECPSDRRYSCKNRATPISSNSKSHAGITPDRMSVDGGAIGFANLPFRAGPRILVFISIRGKHDRASIKNGCSCASFLVASTLTTGKVEDNSRGDSYPREFGHFVGKYGRRSAASFA